MSSCSKRSTSAAAPPAPNTRRRAEQGPAGDWVLSPAVIADSRSDRRFRTPPRGDRVWCVGVQHDLPIGVQGRGVGRHGFIEAALLGRPGCRRSSGSDPDQCSCDAVVSMICRLLISLPSAGSMSRRMADPRAAVTIRARILTLAVCIAPSPDVGVRDHSGPLGAWRWAVVHAWLCWSRPNHVGFVARSKLWMAGGLKFCHGARRVPDRVGPVGGDFHRCHGLTVP